MAKAINKNRKDRKFSLNAILSEITPAKDEERRVMHAAAFVMKTARTIAGRKVPGVKVMLVGSVPKNTALKGVRDIDVFVLFPPESVGSELEDIAMPIIREIVDSLGTPAISKFSQHPYISTVYDGFDFDIVPAYNLLGRNGKIKECEHGCPVDRTPFHTTYVKKQLKKPGEVRLLKKFCRGIGVYGADMQHSGFSGYLCELLVIKYGSFMGVVRAAGVKWKRGDMEKPCMTLTTKPPNDMERFRQDEMIFIDPVDPERNVASAVCITCLETFVGACKDFAKKPSREFFFPKNPPVVRNIPDCVILVLFTRMEGVTDDVISSQLSRVGRLIEKRLECDGFGESTSHDFVSGENLALIIKCGKKTLSSMMTREGPPLCARTEFLDAFRKEHSGRKISTKKGRLVVELPRKYTTPDALIESMLAENTPKHLRTSCTLLSGSASLRDYYDSPLTPQDVKDFISRTLSKKKSWEW